MSSNWRADQFGGPPAASGKPVWVRLDALMLRDPAQPVRTDGSGIDMTGEVEGSLIRWQVTYKGDWMGLVDYSVPQADPGRCRYSSRCS